MPSASEPPPTRPLQAALAAARAALEARAAELDDLNVFPVPDGDTGTNMLATARAAEESANGDPAGLVRGTLLAARGNSGMILSQLLRGAVEALDGASAGQAAAVCRAARGAADAGYGAVRRPVEGTMLTVARRVAEALEAAPAADLRGALGRATEAARAAAEATPEQLAVLREEGVVDAGALGLAILIEGFAAGLLGDAPPAARPTGSHAPRGADHPPSAYRYCTTLLIEGEDLDRSAIERALADVGDSLLVMGDLRLVKVHVHTNDPEAAAALAGAHGAVEGLQADDMRRQEAERAARLRRAARGRARSGAVALLPGPGNRELAEALGAVALPPGASPEELGAAIERLGADEPILVGCGPLPSAAAALLDLASPLLVLSSLVAIDPSAPAADNVAAMRGAAAGVVAAAVEGRDGGFGVTVDGREEIVAGGLEAAVARAVEAVASPGRGIVTVIGGAAAGASAAELARWATAAAGDIEVEAHQGGQDEPLVLVGAE